MSEVSAGGSACGAVRSRASAAAGLGAARLLGLAAAPAFAVMALLAGAFGGGAADMLCPAAASPFGGMAPMYLLMSVFHSAPWLRLISDRRSRVGPRSGALR